jgi:hypothetical protein
MSVAKRSKWIYSFVLGASTVVTDLGLQIAGALSDPNKADIHVLRSIIAGAIVGGVAKLLGMGLAAWVTKKEMEDSDESTGPIDKA